eukprot:GHRR01021979.1.p1 GENE.GHRR01021979.1~~GHRR01021979.1.p1  ORF type:complete len:101 (+),score=22.29 GHRR01021979.1:1445-1747(+)
MFSNSIICNALQHQCALGGLSCQQPSSMPDLEGVGCWETDKLAEQYSRTTLCILQGNSSSSSSSDRYSYIQKVVKRSCGKPVCLTRSINASEWLHHMQGS